MTTETEIPVVDETMEEATTDETVSTTEDVQEDVQEDTVTPAPQSTGPVYHQTEEDYDNLAKTLENYRGPQSVQNLRYSESWKVYVLFYADHIAGTVIWYVSPQNAVRCTLTTYSHIGPLKNMPVLTGMAKQSNHGRVLDEAFFNALDRVGIKYPTGEQNYRHINWLQDLGYDLHRVL